MALIEPFVRSSLLPKDLMRLIMSAATTRVTN
jgi:hypothetical protein